MKLIIDIDEDYYEIIKHDVKVSHNDFKPYTIIANGIPLLKGHGRLIDADSLQKEILSWGMNDYEPSDFIDEIDIAETIIEAESEEV